MVVFGLLPLYTSINQILCGVIKRKISDFVFSFFSGQPGLLTSRGVSRERSPALACSACGVGPWWQAISLQLPQGRGPLTDVETESHTQASVALTQQSQWIRWILPANYFLVISDSHWEALRTGFSLLKQCISTPLILLFLSILQWSEVHSCCWTITY